MTNQEQKVRFKKSIFAELNSLSITAGIMIFLLMLACIAGYIYLLVPTPKTVRIEDGADVFTQEEIEDLKDAAKDLSKRRDMNVIIITTRDKGAGYSDSDEDCAEYCLDQYDEIVRKNTIKDNSGMCIFLDLTHDAPGERFFWMYTYGSTYLAISDSAINNIFARAKSNGLEDLDYARAMNFIIDEVGSHAWNKESELGGTIVAAIIPLVIAIMIYKKTGKVVIDKKPPVRNNRIYDELVDYKRDLIDTKTREELSPQGVAAAALASSAGYSSGRSHYSGGGSHRSCGGHYSGGGSHHSSGGSHGSHGGRGGGGRF